MAKWLLEISGNPFVIDVNDSETLQNASIIQSEFIQRRQEKMLSALYALQNNDIAYECLVYV